MIASRFAPFKVSAPKSLFRTPRSQNFRVRQRRHNSSQQQKTSPEPVRPEKPTDPPTEPPIDPKAVPPLDIPSTIWFKRLGPVTNFFSWFSRTQHQRPYTVQLVTSFTVYLCGDLCAQEIGGEPYDPMRTVRMLIIGSTAAIPGYRWFIWLGNHFNYASKFRSIATKVAVQQAVFTPVFNTYFFGMQAILTGQPPSGVIDRLKKALPVSITNSAKFWPTVTALTFTFIEPQYRFMFSGCFAVIWQSYLSFINRRAEKIAEPISMLLIPEGRLGNIAESK